MSWWRGYANEIPDALPLEGHRMFRCAQVLVLRVVETRQLGEAARDFNLRNEKVNQFAIHSFRRALQRAQTDRASVFTLLHLPKTLTGHTELFCHTPLAKADRHAGRSQPSADRASCGRTRCLQRHSPNVEAALDDLSEIWVHATYILLFI